MSRNDRGEYTPKTKDDEILAYFSHADQPVQTAQSIGEEFDLDRSQAYRRLQQLAADGKLEKAKVGSRAVVWWLADTSNQRSGAETNGVNPEDPIFNRSTFEAGEPEDTSENIDDILYGNGGSGSA